MLSMTKQDFLFREWPASHGGIAWARCTDAAIQMAMAWSRTIRCIERNEKLGDGTITELIRTCNLFITLSHNSGRCLTKFAHVLELLRVTAAPGIYLVHPLTKAIYNDIHPTI